MKKLTLSLLIAAVFSSPVLAGDYSKPDKISSSFQSLDNDSDGYISKEEADDDDIWEHFAKIDGINNGQKDGLISRAEFSAYTEMYMGEVAEDKDVAESAMESEVKDLDPIKHDFATIDDDDSGYISLEEADGHELENHFGYIDQNKDKRISETEFNHYLASTEAKLDVETSVTAKVIEK